MATRFASLNMEDFERILKEKDALNTRKESGEEAQRQMNATLYLECSAKHRENVEDVFKEATRLALDHSRKSRQVRKKRRKCHIM